MKKPLVFLLVLFIGSECHSQVFKTAHTLDPGTFSAGINPVIFYSPGNSGLEATSRSVGFGATYLHFNTGLSRGMDLGLRLMTDMGWMMQFQAPHVSGFGADIRWSLYTGFPMVTISAGAHKFGGFIMDGKLNVTLPLSPSVGFFTGLEVCRAFHVEEHNSHFWLPVGIELIFLRRVSLILENDFSIFNKYDKINKLGAGIRVYF